MRALGRPWRAAPAVIVLALALAGCATPAEPGPVADAPLEPTATAIRLAGCDILEAVVDVPADRAAPFVPPGFGLRASDGMAGVVLGAATCAEGSRAFLAIPVEPEDERLRAEGVRHFYEPEHLVVAGGPFADALLAARGNATLATRIAATAAPPQPAFAAELGTGAHRASGLGAAVAPASDAVIGGVFREWFPADGGYGYLEATFGAEGAAFALLPQASLETAEGTASRDVLGAEATAQLFVLAGSEYADATLGFVSY